jgi:hypothetical protein
MNASTVRQKLARGETIISAKASYTDPDGGRSAGDSARKPAAGIPGSAAARSN